MLFRSVSKTVANFECFYGYVPKTQSGWKIMFQRNAIMMAALKIALILMSLVASSQVFKSDFVLLKTQYAFPGNASTCERAEWRKETASTYVTIASYQNQICTTKNGYHEEFTCKENHLLLNSAKYTDQEVYVFVCGGVVENKLRLEVLYALNVYAAVMDNITLPCYEASAKDGTWIHNNKSVLYYKKDGSIHFDEDYKGRASLEKNFLKTGDFSLTITGFRKTDAGIYRCFLNDEGTKGYPHAYHVSEKPSGQGDQTDTNYKEAQTLTIYKTATIVLGIISFILLVVVVILLYKLYFTSKPLKGQSAPAPATYHVQKSADDTTENTPVLLGNTESQSMVNHPVQESDTTGNKPSNTRPF